jgi:FAD-dependent oxidoreductase family protein/FAD dependent oxidoreductase
MSAQMDIVVVGGGAAGIAAAVSAARSGCKTLLVAQRPSGGGTGGFSGLTTLCGLYDDTGKLLNNGFAHEFTEAISEAAPLQMGKVWVLPYRPERFREAAARFFASTPNLATRWNTPLGNVIIEDSRISRLNGLNVGAVVDCSGSAAVASAIGMDCLATNETTQASAVIFPLRNVTRELNTPAAVAQVLLPLARAGLPPLSLQPSLETNTVTVKFTGSPNQVMQVIEFLQTSVSGFEKCETPLTEFFSAQRAGRMIPGEYLLTGADVLAGRKFLDAVARCAWPIEQWGTYGAPCFRYLAPGTCYEIPARSLRAARVQNLFMAGKTISADVDAIASARVMGCCLATGAAAGKLAAAYVQSSRTA